ncbi:unnamed protein product [Diabrotica balteata]|uniref:Zinc transporter 1 n=1 Tax=Diabrotica balteata TaxID=107213 RepID=A0A9N9SVM9_DIABA|nr:unnamed protein product [Diabrotica balteata]
MGKFSGKKCRLLSMLWLTTFFFFVEIVVGYITNSMALVADSFHMLSDVAALVVAFLSVKYNSKFISFYELSEHGSSHGHSHGRLSHSRNRLTQLAITDDNENDETFPSPPPPTTQLGEKELTHSHSSGQMNMRGVFLHVLSDALGSVIVIVSALVFWLTDWKYKYYIDPALSILLVLLILNSVWPLLRDSALILLQTVPTHIQVDAIQNRLLSKVDGVLAVHEFHVWQLAGDRIIASAHIRCRNLSEYMKIAEKVKEFFHNEGIHSTTIQPEFIDYTDIPTTSRVQEPMTEDLNSRGSYYIHSCPQLSSYPPKTNSVCKDVKGDVEHFKCFWFMHERSGLNLDF